MRRSRIAGLRVNGRSRSKGIRYLSIWFIWDRISFRRNTLSRESLPWILKIRTSFEGRCDDERLQFKISYRGRWADEGRLARRGRGSVWGMSSPSQTRGVSWGAALETEVRREKAGEERRGRELQTDGVCSPVLAVFIPLYLACVHAQDGAKTPLRCRRVSEGHVDCLLPVRRSEYAQIAAVCRFR